jgi:hypothetical protein
MNKQSHIGKKADKTLDSLQGIQKAEPNPYFFTRVKARLDRNQKNVWETTGSFLARPVVAIAGLCLILAVNVFIVLQKDTASSTNYVLDNNQVTEDENIFAAADTYDYENLEP